MTIVNTTTCPSNVNDLTGKKFGRLTVIGFTHTAQRYSFWLCQCDCGNSKVIRRNALTSGDSVSCGCRQQETLQLRTKHGCSMRRRKTKEYRCWEGMIERCTNPNKKKWKDYGGRGIRVCERWTQSFENFLADMGEAPSDDLSIDRIDNDGNYELHNCRWATRTQQARNNRQNRIVTINSESKPLIEWIESAGQSEGTVHARLQRGWSEEEAVLVPPNKRMVEINGVTKTLAEWIRDVGAKYNTVLYRLRRGWPSEKAIMTPTGKRSK